MNIRDGSHTRSNPTAHMLCNLMTEHFDINEALAISYIEWKRTYLRGMPQRPGESVADYCDRMCCIAFVAGAKTVQSMTQQAFIEALAETLS